MRSGIAKQSWVYNAPPTISSFLQSDAFGRLIWGPVGSGKTTACIVEAARRMAEQGPGEDGRRYSRIAIIRQSLKDAKATVLKDIRGWFGSLADWKVSESTLYIEYGDVYSEWPFIPLDEPDDVKRLLSLQLTGAYVNECIETDIDLLSDIAGRVGRYPNNEFGACTWSGIWMDTNAPILGTPWAGFMERPPPEWQVFHQPGGHTEEAENLAHLNQTAETMLLPEDHPARIQQGRGYYNRLLSVGSPDYIRRYVWSQFGRDPSGAATGSANEPVRGALSAGRLERRRRRRNGRVDRLVRRSMATRVQSRGGGGCAKWFERNGSADSRSRRSTSAYTGLIGMPMAVKPALSL